MCSILCFCWRQMCCCRHFRYLSGWSLSELSCFCQFALAYRGGCLCCEGLTCLDFASGCPICWLFGFRIRFSRWMLSNGCFPFISIKFRSFLLMLSLQAISRSYSPLFSAAISNKTTFYLNSEFNLYFPKLRFSFPKWIFEASFKSSVHDPPCALLRNHQETPIDDTLLPNLHWVVFQLILLFTILLSFIFISIILAS